MIALLASAALLTTPALAMRGYDSGPVWSVQNVQTKDGHFDDYMKFVTTKWKAQEEALKSAGFIIDYKVFVTIDARDNEPDIALVSIFKNMAAMDISLDQQDALAKQMSGSVENADKEQQDRGAFRTIRGGALLRELKLQ
jgi:hypothetical protein